MVQVVVDYVGEQRVGMLEHIPILCPCGCGQTLTYVALIAEEVENCEEVAEEDGKEGVRLTAHVRSVYMGSSLLDAMRGVKKLLNTLGEPDVQLLISEVCLSILQIEFAFESPHGKGDRHGEV